MNHRRGVARTSWLAALMVLAIGATGCAGGDSSRQDAVADLAGNDIVPAFLRAADTSRALSESMVNTCAAPDQANLEASRAALLEARAGWKATEAYWFGPIMERRSWALVDWPVNGEHVTSLVESNPASELTTEYLRTRISAAQRGYGAVEFVLGADDALDRVGDPRWCNFVSGVAAVAADELAAVAGAWSAPTADEDYRARFESDPEMAIDDTVNNVLVLLERIKGGELGSGVGAAGGDPDIERVPEGPLALGVADLVARFEGLRHVLVGEDATSGLSPLLSADQRRRLAEELDAVDASVAQLTPPLRGALADQRPVIDELRANIEAVQATVASEVVSRLGVTVAFSDADGDSAG